MSEHGEGPTPIHEPIIGGTAQPEGDLPDMSLKPFSEVATPPPQGRSLLRKIAMGGVAALAILGIGHAGKLEYDSEITENNKPDIADVTPTPPTFPRSEAKPNPNYPSPLEEKH